MNKPIETGKKKKSGKEANKSHTMISIHPAHKVEPWAAIKALHQVHARVRAMVAAATFPPDMKASQTGWFAKPDTKTAVVVKSQADAPWLTPAILASACVDPQVEASLAAFREQVAYVRNTLASVYGKKAVPFRLPVSTTFTATAGTGVVNTALTVRMSDSVEYPTLALLFDEYRNVGGRYEWFIPLPTSTVVLGTSSLTYDACAAIGFDPADNTSASTARGIAELNQHMQVFPRMSMTPTVGTYVGLYGKDDNKPYVFHWSTRDVQIVVDSNGNTTSVGLWKGTAATPQSDGFIKPYFQSGATTAVAAFLGTIYFDVEFRSRT